MNHDPQAVGRRSAALVDADSRNSARRGRESTVGVVLALLTGLLLSSCFEPAITEELEIRFLAQGGVVVTATTKIREDDSSKENRALRDRIARARWELVGGEDLWSRRIAAISPEAERLTWDREQGKLSRAVHRVYLEAPGGLNALLGDAVSLADYTTQPESAQLALYPLTGSRATGQQMKNVRAMLDDWSARVAAYLDASSKLYSYLKRRPDRAEACLFPLFADFIAKAAGPPSEPTDEEQPLIEAAKNSMSDLTKIFDVPPDSAYSPDELFHLVFDPFPAQVRVRTPGKILEVEGFTAASENSVVAPDAGLYGSFKSLEGRWLSPDPFVAYVEQGRHGGGRTFDIASFAARERIFSMAPTAHTVREALEDRLGAAPVYRVKWSTADLAGIKEEITSWDDLASSP